MNIFVNRILNLKTIKAIGLDMDHTLIRYNCMEFETLTFNEIITKLVKLRQYPNEVLSFKFDFDRTIRGVIVDKKQGHLLKVDHFGRVKKAFKGLTPIPYKEMQQFYRGLFVDLSHPDFYAVDTSFSIAETVVFALLVDFKNSHPETINQDYYEIMDDIRFVLDISHLDDSLKGPVVQDPSRFLIQEPEAVKALESFKMQNKVLMLITNSDYFYCQKLLDYCINPYLTHCSTWRDLFDWVITCAEKPSFFKENRRFLKVDPDSGYMLNSVGKLNPGIYQGGGALELQNSLGLEGDEILYIGDHIYGDVVRLKKHCGWRTALVLEELEKEVKTCSAARAQLLIIDKLTKVKEELEEELRVLQNTPSANSSKNKNIDIWDRFNKNNELLNLAVIEYESKFNPYWGEMLRAGAEESFLMGQIRKYACIYMDSVASLNNYYPNHFFRPKRVALPHELSE